MVSDGNILILLLPVAMMALTISSIPVHLDYFRSHAGESGHARLGRHYVAALSWLTLFSLTVLSAALILLPLGFEPLLIAAICLTFLIEKLADEISRALEYRKDFVKWFLVQSLRSGWFVLPIAASMTGADYKQTFIAFSGLILVFMVLTFLRVSGLRPQLSVEGLTLIHKNLVFLFGSFLTAAYLQLPRLFVSKVFPEQAHIYLATAQLCQSVTIVFNVRYQIPYRKLIARRTKRFQQLLWPTMRRLLFPVLSLAFLYLIGAGSVLATVLQKDIWLIALLIPIMIADTLMFALLTAHLGYIQWFADKWSTFSTYLICMGISSMLALTLVSIGLWQTLPLFAVPALTIIMGGTWLLILILRYFRRPFLHD